jgi:hypothetical protein
MRITTFVVALTALASSGCIYVSAPPRRTVVQETRIVAPRETVITTLPPTYRTRVYRGNRYYEYNNVYYRAVPQGYVVVERPW